MTRSHPPRTTASRRSAGACLTSSGGQAGLGAAAAYHRQGVAKAEQHGQQFAAQSAQGGDGYGMGVAVVLGHGSAFSRLRSGIMGKDSSRCFPEGVAG